MTENFEIDELLNAFLDGELSQRKAIEVQRLVKHDSEIAGRLREIEKIKTLLGSLPREQAPDEMLEDIKAALEKSSLLESGPEHFSEKKGERDLLGRKIISIAAMIVLVAGLLAVIYSIVAPENTLKNLLVSQGPAEEITQPGRITVAAAKPFIGRVELKTADPAAIKQAVEKAIGSSSAERENTYTVSRTAADMELLLASLSGLWSGLDSAVLYVDTLSGGNVVIEDVKTGQIAQIVNQQDAETRIKAARYFAAINDISRTLTGNDTLTAAGDKEPDLITIPKPVLTSGGKPDKKTPSGEKHTLTIVVVPAD